MVKSLKQKPQGSVGGGVGDHVPPHKKKCHGRCPFPAIVRAEDRGSLPSPLPVEGRKGLLGVAATPCPASYLNIVVFTVVRDPGEVLVALHQSPLARRDFLF